MYVWASMLSSSRISIAVCHVQAFKDRAGKVTAKPEPFRSSIANFFQTDVISRTSINMAKSVQARASMPHE